MNDYKSNNNSIEISGTITDSTISFNQNQDNLQSFKGERVEYKVDEKSYQEVDGGKYRKAANIYYLSIAIASLGILADVAGIFSYLNLHVGSLVVFFIFCPMCVLVAVLTKNNRWISRLNADGKSYYRDGQWYEKLNNGDVAKYRKVAKCTYPKCNGIINVVSAPPRERPNHNVVGVCSVGEFQHTYTMDYNSIGHLCKFDWRPIQKND